MLSYKQIICLRMLKWKYLHIQINENESEQTRDIPFNQFIYKKKKNLKIKHKFNNWCARQDRKQEQKNVHIQL